MEEECLWLFSRLQIKALLAVVRQQALMLLSTPSPAQTQPSVLSIPVIPREHWLTVTVSFPYLITNGLQLTESISLTECTQHSSLWRDNVTNLVGKTFSHSHIHTYFLTNCNHFFQFCLLLLIYVFMESHMNLVMGALIICLCTG